MSDISLGHWDPYNYFPGLPASSAKLNPLPEGSKIFEFCDKADLYLESKREAVYKNRDWYYQEIPNLINKRAVVEKLIGILTKENSDLFSIQTFGKEYVLVCKLTNEKIRFDNEWNLINHTYNYEDSFSAICMQVPEDIIVQTIVEDHDKATLLHLCHANGWSARWAVGKSFGDIHDGVRRSDNKHVIKTPAKMVKHLVNMKGPIERVGAINFKTDSFLDRHPSHPEDRHSPFNLSDPQLFMRFERQTVTPLPEANSFIFTIKTYMVDCKKEKEIVLNALLNSDKDAYSRHFINKHKEEIIKWLT